MFGSEILDVVIGLVFIYLLYSLFATILQEILANLFSFRSKILEIAIHRMLEEDNPSSSRLNGLKIFFSGKDKGSSFLSNAFYQHPLIKFLGEDNDTRKPSYITKETFSKVIIDLIRGEKVEQNEKPSQLIDAALRDGFTNWESYDSVHSKQNGIVSPKDQRAKSKTRIPDETLSYIRSIWIDSQKDADKFKTHLENWFDQTMERATGWYKKYTQAVLFVIGFGLSVLFNLNTIDIAAKLESNPTLRAHVISQVENFLKAHPNLENEMKEELSIHAKNTNDTVQIKSQYDSLNRKLNTLLSRSDSLVNGDIAKVNNVLGLGLRSFFKKITELKCHTCHWKAILGCYILFFFESLIGWLITAIAISLGAPFWFDLLNKLMKLRSSTAGNADNKKNSPGNVVERSTLERKG